MSVGMRDGWGAPSEERGRDYRSVFLKVPAGDVVQVLVTCALPWRYDGHWDVGGMVPCRGDGCLLCEQRIGRMVRYVFEVFEPATRRAFVWECGETLALCVREISGGASTVRGVPLELRKASQAQRSRTTCVLWAEGELEAVRLFGDGGFADAGESVWIDSKAVFRSWWSSQGWLGPGLDD